jgi:hypothetical protein
MGAGGDADAGLTMMCCRESRWRREAEAGSAWVGGGMAAELRGSCWTFGGQEPKAMTARTGVAA